uniref:Orsellinic acid 3-farnesyltransferase n=1 Tax=Rhododendron dauricum TaxID=880079 RepID=A0A348BF02_RHODA|nr:orsellinic acid 3-farnesyltransferase [Rhododendron dauricum]
MLQLYACSFVPPVKSSLHNQGYLTQIQLPVMRIQNLKYKHSLKNTFGERKTIIRSKLLESHSSEDWHLSDPKKENGVVGKTQRGIFKKWDILCRFVHPYIVMATIIGVTSFSLLPLESAADLSLPFLVGVLKTLVPYVLLNIYTGGINALYDIEIDKVNKPYRPLVTGELSIKSATVIVSTALVTSLAMGIMSQSPPLLYGLVAVFLGTSAYSIKLPLLRWKNNPFLTAVAILVGRGVTHVSYYVHTQEYVLGRPFVLTRSFVFAIAIMSLFAVTFALLKDVPDVDGDRESGVQSFCILAGKEKVFWLGISILLMGYGSAMVVGASSSCLTNKLVTVLGHAALASSLWLRAQSVDLDSKESTSSLYMFVWKLYYVEHLLIHFVR